MTKKFDETVYDVCYYARLSQKNSDKIETLVDEFEKRNFVVVKIKDNKLWTTVKACKNLEV